MNDLEKELHELPFLTEILIEEGVNQADSLDEINRLKDGSDMARVNYLKAKSLQLKQQFDNEKTITEIRKNYEAYYKAKKNLKNIQIDNIVADQSVKNILKNILDLVRFK